MPLLPCPYLGSGVELSEERERHITERHPDLLPLHRGLFESTLTDPDQVRSSARNLNSKLFSRWYDGLAGGKHVVVVVTTEPIQRSRVVTAYIARKLSGGKVEWKRN